MELANCSLVSLGGRIGSTASLNASRFLSCASPTKIIAQEDFFGQSVLTFFLSLSGATVQVPGTDLGIHLGDFVALFEVGITFGVGLAFLAVCAYLAYSAKTCERMTPHLRDVLLWSIIGLLPLIPFVVLHLYGPLASVVTNFVMSIVVVFGFFRLLELACRTGPKGFDSSLKRFVLYVACPPELAFDGEGCIQQGQPGLWKDVLLNLICHISLMVLVISVARPSAFNPWIPDGTTPSAMPMLGFPVSLPALHLQAMFVYTCLSIPLQFFRLLCAAVGFEARDPMRHPLFLSTSVRDFWGRRWNLLIHRMMHRSFFKPLAASLGPRAGAVGAFLASALFHEYMWLVCNWHETDYTFGGPLKFFGVQFVLLTTESLLKQTYVGTVFASLPAPVLTILTTLLILPFGPYFLQDLRGLMLDSVRIYPHFLIAK